MGPTARQSSTRSLIEQSAAATKTPFGAYPAKSAILLSLAAAGAATALAVNAFLEQRYYNTGLLEVARSMDLGLAARRTEDLRGVLPYAIVLGTITAVIFMVVGVFLSRSRRWTRDLVWVAGPMLMLGTL